MANISPSKHTTPAVPSILADLANYGSSSDDSASERSSHYATAWDSTDYDGSDIDDLVSAMSQVTTEERAPGTIGMYYCHVYE